MGRTVNKKGRKPGVIEIADPLVNSGIAPEHGTRGLSRQGTGRLGRALAEAKKAKPGTPKQPKKPVKKRTSSVNASADREHEEGQSPPRSARTPSKAKVARKPVKKKKGTRASSLPNPQPVSEPDRARQRKVKAAAKRSRIKRSGLKSRVLGHVSARGKRAQARRDSRNDKG